MGRGWRCIGRSRSSGCPSVGPGCRSAAAPCGTSARCASSGNSANSVSSCGGCHSHGPVTHSSITTLELDLCTLWTLLLLARYSNWSDSLCTPGAACHWSARSRCCADGSRWRPLGCELPRCRLGPESLSWPALSRKKGTNGPKAAKLII